MGVLYKLTSPSGKSYIGISSKDLDARWRKHVEHALGKRDAGALYAALRKYGPDTFTREVLVEEEDWELLCNLERDAIKAHGTLSPGGYNMTIGGEGTVGVPLSDEARAAISVAQRARFARPEEKAKLLKNIAKMHAMLRAKRSSLPPNYVPPWIQRRRDRVRIGAGTEEHSRRTKAGMARPEVRAKVTARAAERAASPAWRKRISESKRGRTVAPCSELRKQKISEARRREWADPVIRARRRAAIVASYTSRDGKGWMDL